MSAEVEEPGDQAVTDAERDEFSKRIVTAIVELEKWKAADPEGFAAVAELDPEDLDFMRRDPKGFAAMQADVAAMMAEPVTEEEVRRYQEGMARHLAAEEAENQ